MLEILLILAPILVAFGFANWDLNMDPKTYLKRYPEGDHAEQAREVLGIPELREGVADISFDRDGADLVVTLEDFYNVIGVPTKSDNDTRKLASSPGRFTWFPDESEVAHVNPENRRTGFKLVAILSSPRDVEEDESETSESDQPTMSRTRFGS